MSRKGLFAFLATAFLAVATVAGVSTVSAQDTTQDTLTVAMRSDATTIDPQGANNVYSSMVMRQIFDTLIDVDEEGNVTYKIAESYEVSDDGLTYTFKIRQGIKFTNGDEVKASDVAYSLKRAQASSYVAHIFGDIDPDSFETPDDYTVTFSLAQANTGFLAGLSHTGASIVPEAVVEAEGDNFANEPVGCGPFKFVSWSKNDTIVLERNDDYYGELPALKQITFRIITEEANRTIELESGGVDLAFDIAATDISRVEDNSDLQLIRKTDNQTTYLAFNCEKEPWNNKEVRQAISYAIDCAGVVAAATQGVNSAAMGPIAPNVKYHDNDITVHEYNVETAKQMLADAGIEEGQKLVISTNDNQQRIKMATIIQSELKEVGIDVEIETLEWGALLEKAENKEQDAIIVGWTCQTADPDMAVYAPFHTQQNGAVGNNYANFSSETVDALLEQGRTMEDSDEREAIYDQIQEEIVEEAPWVFLNNGEVLAGAKANMKGFEPTPYGYHSLYNIYFE